MFDEIIIGLSVDTFVLCNLLFIPYIVYMIQISGWTIFLKILHILPSFSQVFSVFLVYDWK